MNAHVIHRPCWSTSTYLVAAENAAADMTMLGDHLHWCQSRRGLCFGLCCAIDAIHAFAAPRFFTTLVAACAALALASVVVI